MIDSIKEIAVLGCGGTIGGLIGGIIAQHGGFKVYFLSRTAENANRGLEKAIAQARSEVIARNIACSDYDSSLERVLSKVDWIIECVTEDLSIKQHIHERVDACRKSDSIVSSVTSSLPLEKLIQGRSESLKRNFLSTHFYNPPSKMLACEITGTSETDPKVVNFMCNFLEKELMRVIIPVKNSPAFAGNRIAFLIFNRITELSREHGVELMDYLIGSYTGRIMPPLATIDLVGVDVHKAIVTNLHNNTDDRMHESLKMPAYIDKMIVSGFLGQKSKGKQGFYKELESGNFVFIDPLTCSYIPAIKPHIAFVEKAKNLIHIGKYRDAFDVIKNARDKEADVVMEILLTFTSYSYSLIGEVTESKFGISGIDKVMSFGFNWAPPSLILKILGGKEYVIEQLKKRDLYVPRQLVNAVESDDFIRNYGKYLLAY